MFGTWAVNGMWCFLRQLTLLGGCFVSISSVLIYVFSEAIECQPCFTNGNREPCFSFPRSRELFARATPFVIAFRKTQQSPIMEKPWRAFRREEEWKYGVLH